MLPILMSCRCLLYLLLEPVLLHRGRTILGSGSLQFDLLSLVCLELACDVGLFGRCGCLGDGERLDVAFGVVGLDLGHLVGLELAEVEILHDVDWNKSIESVRVLAGALEMEYLVERRWGR